MSDERWGLTAQQGYVPNAVEVGGAPPPRAAAVCALHLLPVSPSSYSLQLLPVSNCWGPNYFYITSTAAMLAACLFALPARAYGASSFCRP